MTNQLLKYKLEERLNKVSSLDYGNLEPAQIAEVLNKAQDMWVRRQLEGINQTRTGNEGSIRRIDDLQYILTSSPGVFTDNGQYWSCPLPADYIEWSRVDAKAQDECHNCCARPLVIFLGNEADVALYLADTNRQPDYNWATTFATVMNKTVKIWTDDKFDITDPLLTYYRRPRTIVFAGSADPYAGGVISPVDIECEFPDAICELIIDEAASILSGDMDSWNQQQRLTQNTEINN